MNRQSHGGSGDMVWTGHLNAEIPAFLSRYSFEIKKKILQSLLSSSQLLQYFAKTHSAANVTIVTTNWGTSGDDEI